MTRYNILVDREHADSVDNLRYTFNQLLARALQSQCKLLGNSFEMIQVPKTLINITIFVPTEMQPAFQSDLFKNLETFKSDKIEYVHEYRNSGPMMVCTLRANEIRK